MSIQEKNCSHFESIYKHFYPRIVSYIYSKIQDAVISEDLAEEVFFRCYKNYDRFDSSKASMSTWLFVITKNILKNHYRDKKQNVHIEEIENFDVIEYVDFDEAIYLEEISRIIDCGLKSLNSIQRDIVIMKYYKQMDTKEIAQALDMTTGNVRVVLSRALKKLRINIENNKEWE